MTLYHYTCDHGHAKITDTLIPHLGLVWLTDLDAPIRDALGLTSHTLQCDRAKHRYRVLDATTAVPWVAYRRTIAHPAGRAFAAGLEAEHGARPMHWFVSRDPVPVVYDPPR